MSEAHNDWTATQLNQWTKMDQAHLLRIHARACPLFKTSSYGLCVFFHGREIDTVLDYMTKSWYENACHIISSFWEEYCDGFLS